MWPPKPKSYLYSLSQALVSLGLIAQLQLVLTFWQRKSSQVEFMLIFQTAFYSKASKDHLHCCRMYFSLFLDYMNGH
jgi:hypothetical protein